MASLVGVAGWGRLPPAVQRRFAAAHADTSYVGSMALRCSRIGHVYAALTSCFGGPLTHMHATAMPAFVRVSDDGCGGVVWERRFQRGDAGADRIVRSTKELDGHGGLLERTDGGLSMSLDVYEEDGALVFRSRRYWLMLDWPVLGRMRLPLPLLLTPGVCRVAHEDLGDGLFRFTLSMVHPLWGETFHQSGVFVDPAESVNTAAQEEVAQ